MTRVLVIEDNPDNTKLVCFLLEKHGCQPAVAPTGSEGIRLARAGGFGFVLLDFQLPDMDGTAVLAAIRGGGEGAGVPVIAVTSYAMSGDRERLLASGCNGYIEKPIDPMQVMAQIEEILGGEPCGS